MSASRRIIDDDRRVPHDLRGEVATLARDVTNASAPSQFIVQPGHEFLRNRGGPDAIREFQDLKRDTHAAAVLGRRTRAVISREWIVDAAGKGPNERLAADLVRKALLGFQFDAACNGLLDCILNGYAVGEVIWTSRKLALGGRDAQWYIVPEAIKVRGPWRFVFDMTQLEHRLPKDPFTPIGYRCGAGC